MCKIRIRLARGKLSTYLACVKKRKEKRKEKKKEKKREFQEASEIICNKSP